MKFKDSNRIKQLAQISAEIAKISLGSPRVPCGAGRRLWGQLDPHIRDHTAREALFSLGHLSRNHFSAAKLDCAAVFSSAPSRGPSSRRVHSREDVLWRLSAWWPALCAASKSGLTEQPALVGRRMLPEPGVWLVHVCFSFAA